MNKKDINKIIKPVRKYFQDYTREENISNISEELKDTIKDSICLKLYPNLYVFVFENVDDTYSFTLFDIVPGDEKNIKKIEPCRKYENIGFDELIKRMGHIADDIPFVEVMKKQLIPILEKL